MKIRRINDHTKVVGNVQRCELHLETTTQKGWRHHLDIGYDQFYPDKHWEEVPPEPEWVEVDLKTCTLADSGYEVYKPNSTNALVSTYRGLQLRITDGYVKVSELECAPISGQTEEWYDGWAKAWNFILAHQRPMLTVWEKR